MTRKQLAFYLKVHPETISKELRKIGINRKGLLMPNEITRALETVFNPLYFKVTRKKLAELYCVHPETFSNHLKTVLGIDHPKKLSIDDIKNIYSIYGVPKIPIDKYPDEVKLYLEKKSNN